jgi:hypothetical protein
MADTTFQVGDRVKISDRPPYLKSAENMPMLRPPDLVEIGEEGTILSRKPGGYLAVKLTRGTFLIDAQYLAAADGTNPSPLPASPTAAFSPEIDATEASNTNP